MLVDCYRKNLTKYLNVGPQSYFYIYDRSTNLKLRTSLGYLFSCVKLCPCQDRSIHVQYYNCVKRLCISQFQLRPSSPRPHRWEIVYFWRISGGRESKCPVPKTPLKFVVRCKMCKCFLRQMYLVIHVIVLGGCEISKPLTQNWHFNTI